MTAALVEFKVSDGTLFPCLPVRASNGRGLIYPLEGISWCTGPEVVVAIGIGADITVKDGYRVDWIPGSIRLFEDIARQVGEIRAEAKAQQPPDLVLDKTVKELVNSVLRQDCTKRCRDEDHSRRPRSAQRLQHNIRHVRQP